MDEKKKDEKKRIKPRWDVNPLLFLLWLFQRTEKDVVEEILRNRRNITAFSEQVAMENVRRTLQTMNEECFKVVPKMFERQFTHGIMEMTAEQEIMAETLTDTLLSNIVASTTTAQTTAQALYRIARLDDDVFTKAIQSSAEYFQLVGNWEVYNADMMETYLRNHGVTAFIDRAGRKWSLRAYCDMATRTANAQARNAEVLTKDAEHDLYHITTVGTTCDICAPLEGRVYSKSGTSPYYPPLSSAYGKIDPNGSNDLSNTWLNIHPNCLVPGGSVLCESVMAESRRLYNGEVITLDTSGGNKITVTPNHPILTDRGFIPACCVHEGDKVIEATAKYARLFGKAPNNIDVPTVVNEELHALMHTVSGSTCCVKGSAEQFHGDGGTDSEINVILSDRFAKRKRYIVGNKKIHKISFPSAHFRRVGFDSNRAMAKVGISALFTSDSIMRLFGFVCRIKGIAKNPKNLSDLRVGAPTKFCDFAKGKSLVMKAKKFMELVAMRFNEGLGNGRIVSSANPEFLFDANKFIGGNAEFGAHLDAVETATIHRLNDFFGNGGLAKADVVHINTSHYNGYVYNFETKYGFFAYNNIITHNCRHYLVPYSEEGKTQNEINAMRKFSSFEDNPITNDPRSKEQIEAYRAEQRKRARITRELRKKAEKG